MNAECALFGHAWFFRFAIRLRMCRRCLRIDVPDSPRGAASVSPGRLGVARGAGTAPVG